MLYHAETKTIIYSGEESALVPDALVWARRDRHTLVKAGYGALLQLTAAGLEVPDPMASYDWPIKPGDDRWTTQKEVSRFMVLNPRSFVFSDMRTGKTRAALWATDWIMGHAKRARVRTLVVSDLNALEDTWAHEITTNLLGRRTYAMLHGTAAKREKELKRDVDYYLLNHDGLRVGYAWPKRYGERREARLARCCSLARDILARTDIKLVVFDEAATYRERSTAMWHAASDLASKRAGFVWGLTGTPTPNGPLDAFGLKKLVQPAYEGSYRAWADYTTFPISQFKREPNGSAAARVDELLSPAIRISQDQCFTPTPVSVETHDVAMSDEQKARMRELKNELVILVNGKNDGAGAISAVNQAALRMKLLQIACGVVYDDEHKSHVIDAEYRLKAYRELVAVQPGKVITFVPFINTQSMLYSKLGNDAMQIESGLTPKRKFAALREFLEGDKKILLSHPGPIARGVDLTEASTIIWYAPTDRTEHYIQANERINGINQKYPRKIIRLSGCAVERDIYDKLEANASMLGVILKLKEMII
jgi:SNF2-related domain/Helicase conserved C-terminal domain